MTNTENLVQSVYSTVQCECSFKLSNLNVFEIERHVIGCIETQFKSDHYDFCDIYFTLIKFHKQLDCNLFRYIIQRSFETQISRRLLVCKPITANEKEKFEKMKKEYTRFVLDYYTIL
jgi:hypothetical protein